MKKLFIIIGNGADFEESLLKKVASELKHSHIERIHYDDIRALKKTLELLEQDEIKDYGSYFVLYAGLNLRDLRETLPCGNIDAALYIRKLTETIGGYKTEEQQKLVFDLFVGGITRVIG